MVVVNRMRQYHPVVLELKIYRKPSTSHLFYLFRGQSGGRIFNFQQAPSTFPLFVSSPGVVLQILVAAWKTTNAWGTIYAATNDLRLYFVPGIVLNSRLGAPPAPSEIRAFFLAFAAIKHVSILFKRQHFWGENGIAFVIQEVHFQVLFNALGWQ